MRLIGSKRDIRAPLMASSLTPMMSAFAVVAILRLSSNVADGLATPAPLRLKKLLQAEMDGTRKSDKPILLPCCYSGLSARLVARAGFEATFMTGFGVSGVNGYPDTQLVSYGEMQSAANTVAEGLSSAALEMGQEPIPCIADGDTGYGYVWVHWMRIWKPVALMKMLTTTVVCILSVETPSMSSAQCLDMLEQEWEES
jgi:isocitrate lyase